MNTLHHGSYLKYADEMPYSITLFILFICVSQLIYIINITVYYHLLSFDIMNIFLSLICITYMNRISAQQQQQQSQQQQQQPQ